MIKTCHALFKSKKAKGVEKVERGEGERTSKLRKAHEDTSPTH